MEKNNSDNIHLIKGSTDKVIDKEVIGDSKDSLSDLKNSEKETIDNNEKSSKIQEIR